jgi:hypothetical protein
LQLIEPFRYVWSLLDHVGSSFGEKSAIREVEEIRQSRALIYIDQQEDIDNNKEDPYITCNVFLLRQNLFVDIKFRRETSLKLVNFGLDRCLAVGSGTVLATLVIYIR